MEELKPLFSLEKEYENLKPTFSFDNVTNENYALWKENFRIKLIELLGIEKSDVSLDTSVTETKEFDTYIRKKLIYRTAPYIKASAYLLIPKNINKKTSSVIALCGHGYGNRDIVGINADGTDRSEPKGYQKDFAVELVKKGLIVLAPEHLGFGERREEVDIKADPNTTSCRQAAFYAMMLGKTLLGMRVHDTFKAIDLLQSMDIVDKDKIGIMGISGGGTISLFTAALDDRIKAVVISGYLCTFKDSILSIRHCEDNYIPGILNYGEMYDIASLIAPRPLLIESGTNDPIFPIKGVDFAYNKVMKAYEFLNASDKLIRDVFEGDHMISGRFAYDFMKENLH